MATKKQKLNFSKFYPEEDFYVALNGVLDPSADLYDMLDMNLTIQNGTHRAINFYTWFSDKGMTLKQLKAINEATSKAIKFLEDADAAKKEKKAKPIVVEKRVTKQRK